MAPGGTKSSVTATLTLMEDAEGGDARELTVVLPAGGLGEIEGRPGVLLVPGAAGSGVGAGAGAPGGRAGAPVVQRPAAQVALRVRDALDAGREVWATVELEPGGGEDDGDDGDAVAALLSVEIGGASEEEDGL